MVFSELIKTPGTLNQSIKKFLPSGIIILSRGREKFQKSMKIITLYDGKALPPDKTIADVIIPKKKVESAILRYTGGQSTEF